jgi:hypothetical protein
MAQRREDGHEPGPMKKVWGYRGGVVKVKMKGNQDAATCKQSGGEGTVNPWAGIACNHALI